MNLHHEILSPAFEKFHVQGLPFATSFNHFTEPDTGDPHDHPFNFVTHILYGGYWERVFSLDGNYSDHFREPGTSHKVTAETIHLITDLPAGECYTLMVHEDIFRETRYWRFENGKPFSRLHFESEFKLYEI